ncbi:Pyridoxal 4-dehydrogenase [Planctomycetes bacterium Pan216]|uniref:Pyridoxal 4-dehydrogenase n=1 Tax=Kolteria novifilia TaxID=2527975 RepID=A0A518B9F3_9BACT|nr:Pyridoxal 4-dehydrogenase [Planctomycetes bacterium Pan216]
MHLGDVLSGNLGFGSAPLGNLYRNIPDEEAVATIEAAWKSGIRYFDVAPLYGAGLAEIRLGEVLSRYPREEFVISTKVGKIILDEVEDPTTRDLGEKTGLYEHGRPNKIANDYSESATLRSIEESLKRLETDRIDIIWVHDVAQDAYGDEWLGVFENARKGAFKALDRLRDEGVIKAWGLGVNRVEPIELILDLDAPRPDGFLLAGRYTLLDHDKALQRVMPEVTKQGLSVVVGGAYSSGALVGGPNFEYAPAPPEILRKVADIKAIADRHGVSMKSAGLHFVLASPVVVAVIPGASKPSRIAEDLEALQAVPPAAFWQELRSQGLVHPDAPLPGDA